MKLEVNAPARVRIKNISTLGHDTSPQVRNVLVLAMVPLSMLAVAFLPRSMMQPAIALLELVTGRSLLIAGVVELIATLNYAAPVAPDPNAKAMCPALPEPTPGRERAHLSSGSRIALLPPRTVDIISFAALSALFAPHEVPPGGARIETESQCTGSHYVHRATELSASRPPIGV